MKVKAMLLFLSFACVPAVYSFGQTINCTTSTKLVCQFPTSAGVLGTFTIGGPQFLTEAQQQARPINASIAAQLTQLPIPSATIGIVSLKTKGEEVGVPFENLGPILTDRPDTVGKGHIFVGFSYQHFNFNSDDGVSLNALPVSVSFSQPSPFSANDTQTFYGSLSNNVGFTLDQYVGIATVGITKTTDVSVIVPFNVVDLRVTASNFSAFYYDSASKTYTNASPAAGTTVSTAGSAAGVGDVTISLKQMLIGSKGTREAVAVGVSGRVGTGDALNYLGSGTYGVNVYGLFEYRARFAPHGKVAYQWNGNSQLVPNANNSSQNGQLPGGLQYDIGADLKLFRQLTVAGDVLGSQFVNAPSFSLVTSPLSPAPAVSGIPSTFTSVTSFNNTYSTANVSGGLKWAPNRHLLFYGNVLEQFNNVGLKSNLVPTCGIAIKR